MWAAGPCCAPHVHAVHPAGHDGVEPRGGVPDVHLLGAGRGAQRLSLPALHRASVGRCRAGDDGDDLRVARCAHHPGMCRHLERRPTSGLEAHRRFCARQQRRQDGAANRSCRTQRLDPTGLGRHRSTAGAGQLALDRAVAIAAHAGCVTSAARDDACRHGCGQARLCGRHRACPRSRI